MNLSLRQMTILQAIAIFGCGLILFTFGLSHQEIIGFEARFYLFALEMWRHGPGLFPTTYGAYYPDYPVTSTWIIYSVAKLFGGLNKFTAIFPSAVAAAVTLAVTYLIGALHNWRFGWCAVFLMLLTNTFVMEARTISPDQYVGMATAICFYLIYSASLFNKNKRLWLLPLFFVLGFSIRGPIGLIVPAGTVCVFYLLNKNLKQFFLMGFMALAVLVFCCGILFALAYHAGGMDFVREVIRMQVSGRLQDANLPWYFYFYESLGAYALTYPLAILAAVSLFQQSLSQNERKLMRVLLGWALIIVVGLSIPAGKKIRYLLAWVPALALLSAFIFSAAPQQKYLTLLRKISIAFFFCLPVLCFVGTCVIYFMIRKRGLIADVPYFSLLLAFFIFTQLNYVYRKKEIFILGVAALTFMTSYVFVVERINLALNKTHEFVLEMEKLRHQQHAQLVFYQENPDGLPIKYLINMPVEEKPLFIASVDALEKFTQPAFVISDPDRFAQMPATVSEKFKVIYSGQVGHDIVLVFKRP